MTDTNTTPAITDPEHLLPAGQKVAIVHDWLVGGGAERVVLELHRMFPEAPIYTSYCTDEWRAKLDNKVITGWLQHWPFSRLRKFIPFLRIIWAERLDLSRYDLVISSSGNGEAKGVKAGSKFKAGQTHVCYCHSPTHFYWRHYDQYMKQPGFGRFDGLARLVLRLTVGRLRKWDLKASQRPDYYIANSEHIKQDIAHYYERGATVIHPPVDIERFAAPGQPVKGRAARQGFVTVGRQTPFKKTGLLVEACARLGLPLTVIGTGPDHDRLVQLAGSLRAKNKITFITGKAADDRTVTEHIRGAQAFLFAAHEDFGITPIEALAAGTPVIAYRAGGALDYIQPGVNGTFFEQQSAESLAVALREFDIKDYTPSRVHDTATAFSAAAFQERMQQFLDGLANR